ncbi:MAG TPA: hypothetical protein VGD58_28450 [Herpetosiphonaceae bacterium]
MTSLMIPASQTSAYPCPCGCAECSGGGCGLECLEHPRFFCGQLLTDQDLTALVSWSQAKFRLGRFRHGWGIVCGLEVAVDVEHARTQPDNRTSRVVVSPGYAVSCCGDDLVLCQPETIDLGAAFENTMHQCQEPRPPAQDQEEPALWRFGGLKLSPGEVRVVDLVLQYQEQLISPQPALGHSARGQQPACDYSRSREVAKVDWRCSDLDALPAEEAALNAWREKYQAIIALVDEFKQQQGEKGSERQAQWLRKLIAEQEWHVFRFVPELAAITPSRRYSTLLFWLIQERLSALRRDQTCPECPDGDNLRVPLARIWLRAIYDRYHRRVVDVLHIDTTPSARRSLSLQQRWPARPGAINLTQFLWQSPEAVRAALDVYSVSVTETLWELDDIDSVQAGLGDKAFVAYGGDVTMYVLDTWSTGRRVSGFS